MIHSMPQALPGDWLMACLIPSSLDGCYAQYRVLRYREGSQTPWQVHTAAWRDDCGQWDYGTGRYFYEDQEDAARVAWVQSLRPWPIRAAPGFDATEVFR